LREKGKCAPNPNFTPARHRRRVRSAIFDDWLQQSLSEVNAARQHTLTLACNKKKMKNHRDIAKI